MAQQKVIVKHLPAMQNFGSMDVLCSDKTGTLTSGDDGAPTAARPVRTSLRSGSICWPT